LRRSGIIRLRSSWYILLGGRDTEERMHRFVTFIGGTAPEPPMGTMSDRNCVILGNRVKS